MKNFKFIAGLVVAILFLIFLVQNTAVVTVRLYFWEIPMSQIILILLLLILGFLLGYIVAKVRDNRRNRRNKAKHDLGPDHVRVAGPRD